MHTELIHLINWEYIWSHHYILLTHHHLCLRCHLPSHVRIELLPKLLLISWHHLIRHHLSKILIHSWEPAKLVHLIHRLFICRKLALTKLLDEICNYLLCISRIEIYLVYQGLSYLRILLHNFLNYITS